MIGKVIIIVSIIFYGLYGKVLKDRLESIYFPIESNQSTPLKQNGTSSTQEVCLSDINSSKNHTRDNRVDTKTQFI